jgi:DNA mismatch repair ATPase MutS
MITGSNMSGKSSFLRTLGINLALANTGAVVNATHLQISPFRIYTCIKVSDSLAEGYSYFYAEVRRLKALLDALEQTDTLPLFFLIDEIFKGTNNRERLLGSEAYIHALIGKRGTGAISTHDLELANLTGLSNYHFADQVRDGQLTFDYTLRPGISPTTNALRIMRLAGLPVAES